MAVCVGPPITLMLLMSDPGYTLEGWHKGENDEQLVHHILQMKVTCSIFMELNDQLVIYCT